MKGDRRVQKMVVMMIFFDGIEMDCVVVRLILLPMKEKWSNLQRQWGGMEKGRMRDQAGEVDSSAELAGGGAGAGAGGGGSRSTSSSNNKENVEDTVVTQKNTESDHASSREGRQEKGEKC
eukprot:766132-Hanusia_phi.AAC.2